MLALALLIPAVAVPAAGGDETIPTALRDEMARSVESLQLEDLERPFYIEYRVDDMRQHWITGSFGSLVRSKPTRMRMLNTDIRVGDHDLDNSEFISTDLFRRGRFMQARPFPLADDYYAMRRVLWLATDEAYKIGLEVLAKKRAHRQNRVEDEPVPDFSREEAHVSIGEVLPYEFDVPRWEEIVRKLSAIFREYPGIDDSGVDLRVQHLVRFYLNSDGSEYRKSEPSAILYATATAYADDGAALKDYVRFIVPLPGDFPDEKDLERAVRDMAAELTALQSAPVIEDYDGPVLFTQSAAADLMVRAVGLQCVGQRLPESDMPQLVAMLPEPALAGRLGKRATSDVVTVFDDPTKTEYGGEKLAGTYTVDDQGVAAQKVSLIEGGTVTSLLMSRRPHKEIAQSNGHARMPAFGVIGSDVTIGNLFVESPAPKSFDELKQDLLAICADEGLEFGLIVRKLDDEALTGVDVDSPEAMMAMYQKRTGIGLGAPVAMFRVYADGREELVRGIGPVSVGIRSLRDIADLGDDSRAYNMLLTSGGGVFGGGPAQDFRISTAVPAAVVTPSVLFEEFELEAAGGAKKKPTLLAHPAFTEQ
jgi:predicted Zn-dependent protease